MEQVELRCSAGGGALRAGGLAVMAEDGATGVGGSTSRLEEACRVEYGGVEAHGTERLVQLHGVKTRIGQAHSAISGTSSGAARRREVSGVADDCHVAPARDSSSSSSLALVSSPVLPATVASANDGRRPKTATVSRVVGRPPHLGLRGRGVTQNPGPSPIAPVVNRDCDAVTWAAARPASAPLLRRSSSTNAGVAERSAPLPRRASGGEATSGATVRSGADEGAMTRTTPKARPGQPLTRTASGSTRCPGLEARFDVATNLRSVDAAARELTRFYCLMQREPIRGIVREPPLYRHPAKQALDKSFPKTRPSSGSLRPRKSRNNEAKWNNQKFHSGKRDGFDFWRDLKMPFYVKDITKKEAELFAVTYVCALSYCADHLNGMTRDGMVYESKISGVAEVFIPDKPGHGRCELLSWGLPQLITEHPNAWLGDDCENNLGLVRMAHL